MMHAFRSIFRRDATVVSQGDSMRQVKASAPRAVTIAPDKFKGTLTAEEVAQEIRNAVAEAFPHASIRLCPMADGGEGTAATIARHMGLTAASTTGHDALMQPVAVSYFRDGNNSVAVDSSAIVGLTMLQDQHLRPWHTTSYGLGEFIATRLAEGVRHIYVGIGGTATIDGGAGMLQALGAKMRDVSGAIVGTPDHPITAGDLWRVFSIDFSTIDLHKIKDTIVALADVDLPLIPTSLEEVSDMTHMSSLSFARQKGLAKTDMPHLYESLANFAEAVDTALLPTVRLKRFNGAGGGIGYALHRVLHCECLAGADYLTELSGIFDNDEQTDCLITGEGCFDAQSLTGKVTGTLIGKASAFGIPTVVVAGKCNMQLPADGNVRIIETQRHMPPDEELTHQSAIIALRAAMPELIQAISLRS